MNRPLTPRATPSSKISLPHSFRSCYLLNSNGRPLFWSRSLAGSYDEVARLECHVAHSPASDRARDVRGSRNFASALAGEEIPRACWRKACRRLQRRWPQHHPRGPEIPAGAELENRARGSSHQRPRRYPRLRTGISSQGISNAGVVVGDSGARS